MVATKDWMAGGICCHWLKFSQLLDFTGPLDSCPETTNWRFN